MTELWPSEAVAEEDIEIELLLRAIYLKFHYDFRNYARSSLRRRLDSALSAFNCRSFSLLQDRVLHDESAFPQLMRYLTIQVSDLFRDAEYFRSLRTNIVPVLHTYPSLRIWVAGCSTGEEAYSHAIVLAEEGLLEKSTIYATDINRESLNIAQAGIYPSERLQTFADNHRRSGASVPLSNHCTSAYGSVVFARSIRERILFSDHSLVTDGVFAEMQVVSCRNVLIYFERALQNRALRLFKDSLCRRGYLGLGAPETLRFTEFERDFTEVAQRWYQRC
ncbi:MAG TPA: CheR family methyltransferase [Polyangiaceae bacterium]|nr:CheR family methyltransferase [Polyangiaceae bacterium]